MSGQLVIIPHPSLERLELMRSMGSSVILNWGEDDDLWECSWIVGGFRYSGFHRDIRSAIDRCWVKRMRGQDDPEFSQ